MNNNELWAIVDELKPDYTYEWFNLNYRLIPVTVINAEIGNEVTFNKIYKWLLKSNFNQITRTKSGGISISKEETLNNLDKYDVQSSMGCCEITICTPEKSCRIQFRIDNYKYEEEEELISGKQALNLFIKELKKDGIDLKDYAIKKEDGIKINETIQKPDIRLLDKTAIHPFDYNLNKIYENAFHIDFHKFYMSGLKMAHPEFAGAIDRLAEKAKSKDPRTKAKYKTAMAATIGCMHSKYIAYKYAHLAKDAIETAYKRYYEVFEDVQKKGYTIVATNTDGQWIVGPGIYHNEDLYEGEGLTQWGVDHKNCTLRFKSAGSYEYIEDGSYYPVVRGRTKLDNVMPRTEWEWGDIFLPSAQVNYWKFVEGDGIIWK